MAAHRRAQARDARPHAVIMLGKPCHNPDVAMPQPDKMIHEQPCSSRVVIANGRVPAGPCRRPGLDEGNSGAFQQQFQFLAVGHADQHQPVHAAFDHCADAAEFRRFIIVEGGQQHRVALRF